MLNTYYPAQQSLSQDDNKSNVFLILNAASSLLHLVFTLFQLILIRMNRNLEEQLLIIERQRVQNQSNQSILSEDGGL
jgi:hypothetical protein